MENNEKLVINELNINNYTIEDLDMIKNHTKLSKEGYPLICPLKDIHGKKILLTFINADIYDVDGNLVSKEKGNFNVYEDEEFNRNDENSLKKIEFISALLSNKRYVKGGVYFKGKYYTSKMTISKAEYLTQSFMHSYFHLEDGDLILEWFDKMGQSDFVPFWPTKSYDKKKNRAIFSAVNARIRKKDSEIDENEPCLNFNIFTGDTFDLNNAEDVAKAEVIHSLLDSNRIVTGFYYKGKLIEQKISKKRKLYFEKTFVKKNFTVNQRDYLLTTISKDAKSNYPLFWPMKDKDNREIVVSVVNACASWFDHKYANFDVYSDEKFDLTKEEFQIKLKIIQQLYSNNSVITGGLYLDGMLIPGNMNYSEVVRRKEKVEKALKIFFSENEDFMRISMNFFVEDREKLLRVVSKYDKFYPDDVTLVENKDKSYDPESNVLVKVVNANVVKEYGDYEFASPYSCIVEKGSKDCSDELFTIIKAIANKTVKVRGAVYYKGVNVARSKDSKMKTEFISSFAKDFLSSEKYAEMQDFANNVKYYRFQEDRKTKMPLFWATQSKLGKEALLSVADADVHFKTGRSIVKAANDMNFDIFVGETFGLVGESGSGKTTISRAILGINKLTNGAIYFKGKLISSGLNRKEQKANKKNIQMIFQDPAASLNERANVDYIVSEGLYNYKLFIDAEDRRRKVVEMLAKVGLLPEHLTRYPHEFSGGQRQRIGIARALVIEPQLVLADEPISALDVSIRAQVLNLLKRLQEQESLTYLFIAHDLSIIRYISDRIAVMHQGYVVELGPAEEIYSNPLHPYTKSLLTAIPQPDPKTKSDRVRVPYSKGDLVYENCYWCEVNPGHYVLVNDRLKDELVKKSGKGKKTTKKTK